MCNGQVLHVLSGSGSRGVFPNIDTVAPRAVLASAPRPVTLSGANLAVPDNAVLARCQGAPRLWQACANVCYVALASPPGMSAWWQNPSVSDEQHRIRAVQAGRCASTSVPFTSRMQQSFSRCPYP